eukprot:c43090_g1_i1 orf=67-267(+)
MRGTLTVAALLPVVDKKTSCFAHAYRGKLRVMNVMRADIVHLQIKSRREPPGRAKAQTSWSSPPLA